MNKAIYSDEDKAVFLYLLDDIIMTLHDMNFSEQMQKFNFLTGVRLNRTVGFWGRGIHFCNVANSNRE